MTSRHLSGDLSGQVALVTGASRGLGAVIARVLAEAGAHVHLNFVRGRAAAEDVAAAIVAGGGQATLAPANLARPDEIARLAETMGPRLDILVHNAAIGSFKPVLDVRANQWDLTMHVNARALLLCAQRLRGPLTTAAGRIIAVSSLGSARVVPSYGAIGISKAALEATVRYLAAELGADGVRVNAVTAGLLDLPSVRQHPGFDALAAGAIARSPDGRIPPAEDVARAVLLLCSPLADGINGQTLVVDRGASIRW